MDYISGCCICGKELAYNDNNEGLLCFYCGGEFSVNVKCADGHYVCDHCHSMPANDLIERCCVGSTSENPIDLAIDLMRSPAVKTHGPEHHFLVPAVLIAAYYNKKGLLQEKEKKIKKARNRADKVLGGFCGTHGNCGAAVGAGIFASVITNATPLSEKEWKDANMTTAKSLLSIAEHGGPRCCKRDSFLAISAAMEYFENDFQRAKNIKCEFHERNKQCLKERCPFFAS